jgi:hypothetical protein
MAVQFMFLKITAPDFTPMCRKSMIFEIFRL